MTTFRFALAGLLRLRGFQLDTRRRELGNETEAWRDAVAERESGESAAREGEEREARALADGVDALHAATLRNAVLAQRGRATTAAERVEQAAANVAASRERVREAWRRLRVVEQLHQRALERHRRESQRRDQRDLDEAARTRRNPA